MNAKIQKMIEENQGKKYTFDSYAWPGGCPLYYITKDNGILCPNCANENKELTTGNDDAQWNIVEYDVNWEDSSLYCDHCGKRIESAYAEEED